MSVQRSLIEFYLSKVAGGDRTYLTKLCEQLADRLVYVPLTAPVENEAGTTTVNVLTLNEGGNPTVPIFTSEKKFKNWCFNEGHADLSFSLLGGDLCAVLGGSKWIRIDAADAHSIALPPAHVETIAESGLTDAAAQPEAPTPQAPPAAQPAAPAAPVAARADEPKEESVIDTVVRPAPAPSSAAKKPTEEASLAERMGTFSSTTSTNISRVIFSSAAHKRPTEEEAKQDGRKKKSFLSFLKSGKN